MQYKFMLIPAFFIILISISSCTNQFGGCTKGGRSCPDGTIVGREGINCEFKECPQRIYCGADQSTCPTGYECISSDPKAYCVKSEEICTVKCQGKECTIMESYPAQVRCNN